MMVPPIIYQYYRVNMTVTDILTVRNDNVMFREDIRGEYLGRERGGGQLGRIE